MRYGLSDATIHDLCGVFCRYPNIHRVYIFGSRAKGNYRSGSDIDLALEGTDIDQRFLQKVSIDIDDLGLLYGIDLLDLRKHQNDPIGQHVNRVGQLFFSQPKQ